MAEELRGKTLEYVERRFPLPTLPEPSFLQEETTFRLPLYWGSYSLSKKRFPSFIGLIAWDDPKPRTVWEHILAEDEG